MAFELMMCRTCDSHLLAQRCGSFMARTRPYQVPAPWSRFPVIALYVKALGHGESPSSRMTSPTTKARLYLYWLAVLVLATADDAVPVGVEAVVGHIVEDRGLPRFGCRPENLCDETFRILARSKLGTLPNRIRRVCFRISGNHGPCRHGGFSLSPHCARRSLCAQSFDRGQQIHEGRT